MLILRDFALRPDDGRVTMVVNPGQQLCLLGPAASGKSHLMRLLAGRERASIGQITAPGEVRYIEPSSLNARAKVAPIKGGTYTNGQTRLLGLLHLWDIRNQTLGDLSPGQVAAAEIYAALSGDASVVILDGVLDLLDPITRNQLDLYLAPRRDAGLIVVIVTHDLNLAERSDALLVLQDSKIKFAGSPPELQQTVGPVEITVETNDQPAVRALVEPFAITAEQTPEGWKLKAKEGQTVAAKLLTEGYGDIKWLITKSPTLTEALAKLLT